MQYNNNGYFIIIIVEITTTTLIIYRGRKRWSRRPHVHQQHARKLFDTYALQPPFKKHLL